MPRADAEARREQSLAALESGGLPLPAQERLDGLRRRGDRFFTSDLSANEFLRVREAGFRPVTQVMGSCFYHVGYQWLPSWRAPQLFPEQQGSVTALATSPWFQTQRGETLELETQTEAWNEARRLALDRLREEAARAGADAVVGVRLQRGAYDWAQGLLEFVVAGTAIASDRYYLAGADGPLLSNLTGQEFAKLFRAGWAPVGLVAGSTVCYVLSGWSQMRPLGSVLTSWQNQELPDFTRGMSQARTQAMMRASRQAHELGAHALVGVQFEHDEHEHEADRYGSTYRDLVVTMHVLGTAIVELARPEEPPPVYIALPLDQERR